MNDTYGYDSGDTLIKKVAAKIKGSICESDVIFPMGGDEVLLILPDIDMEKEKFKSYSH